MEIQAQELTDSATAAGSERQLLVERVRRWGGLASAAIIDPACEIFSPSTIDGLIGYRSVMGCAIVFGDPVCDPATIPQLVAAFHKHCQEQHKSVMYITTSASFAKWALDNVCKAALEVGEELVIDPHCDPRDRTGAHGILVRKKVKHALHEGVTVTEHLTDDASTEQAIEQVATAWLHKRQGPQIYLSQIRLFEDRLGKRWFYAKQGEHIIGVVVLHQLKARQGWLLDRLMVTPNAPNGTPELLVVTALGTLASENCSFVTFGIVPTEQLGEIKGLGKVSTWLAQRTFNAARKIFHLEGRKKFWEKFHPQSEPSFVLFSQPRLRIREVGALMRALNLAV